MPKAKKKKMTTASAVLENLFGTDDLEDIKGIIVPMAFIKRFHNMDRAAFMATLVMNDLVDNAPIHDDRWFPATYKDMTAFNGISAKRMRNALKELRELGFVETKMAGIPAQQWFRINYHMLMADLEHRGLV